MMYLINQDGSQCSDYLRYTSDVFDKSEIFDTLEMCDTRYIIIFNKTSKKGVWCLVLTSPRPLLDGSFFQVCENIFS